MSDQPRQDLREISHLFLSGLREKQTGGAPRPTRIGPGQRGETPVDLSAEELAQVSAGGSTSGGRVESACAVLGAHFDQRQSACARQYAAQIAQRDGRVALVEIEASELRLTVFDPQDSSPGEPLCPTAPLDPKGAGEALAEVAFDIDRWLLSIGPAIRAVEARELMRRVGGFVLLSSCEPDGIVAAYRTLKGTADLVRHDARPALTLAVVDASDAAHAGSTFDKIKGVADQFLNWSVSEEHILEPTEVVGQTILHYTFDKTASGAAWAVLGQLFDGLVTRPKPAGQAAPPVTHSPAMTTAPSPAATPAMMISRADDDAEEIVELPGGDDAASVLSAVIAGASSQWIECPIRAPMYDEARLVVTRDRALVLLAVAKKGLTDLRAIGQAYQWLSQNRPLISMALPQLAIDPHQLPRLQLLIDHADATAELLQPMLRTGQVSVTAYRKVRFSGRRGLLLEAA